MGAAWGWAGSVREFLDLSRDEWLASLREHLDARRRVEPNASQERAWVQEHEVCRAALDECITAYPHVLDDWSVVFEFELPLAGGRRPDVIVLAGRGVVLVEFKGRSLPKQGEVDSVRRYANDLADYHGATHGLPVAAVLVLADAAPGFATAYEGVMLTAPEGLSRYLVEHSVDGTIDRVEWLRAPYEPLPSLVEAARRIFEHEPLPHVRQAHALGVPQTTELLGEIVDKLAAEGGRVLALVTGVPGAGKTLVGLELAHRRSATAGRAIYLSGNGPLIKVLQDALGSTTFVRNVHEYIQQFVEPPDRVPAEGLVVFDEAQRAWDADHMERKRKVRSSEPALLVQISERHAKWSSIVALLGDGQQIHVGEEAGLSIWRDAVSAPNAEQSWTVHCPPQLASEFDGLPAETHERLNLTASLRSKRAEDLHQWVSLVLQGSINLAARAALRIQRAGFPMYVTRDLDEVRRYLRERFGDDADARYGLLGSSHARTNTAYGVSVEDAQKPWFPIGKWFNAPPDDERSCCQLRQAITEFQCQGLELDIGVVCWGDDLAWEDPVWSSHPRRRRPPLDDPEQVLRNAYRVLLTRSREALVVFVPPGTEYDSTERALLAAGVLLLPEEAEGATPARAVGEE